MSEALPAQQCQNPDCLVAKTGACREGHSPVQSCPKYGLTPDEPDDDELEVEGSQTVVAGASVDSASSSIRLPSGETLTAQEVALFQLWKEPIFVAIVGDNDSGKTTLIGALYDQFLRGPFAGCSFAGSRTLMSMEKRWYLSRIDSELTASQTEHTSRQAGLHYYHLALQRGAGVGGHRHLLISDRAGEVYKEARNRSEVARSLPELSTASRVVILVDGARVADAGERADVLQGARQSVRVFLDQGGLGASSLVKIVITKADLIAASTEREVIEHHLEHFRASLARDFSARLGALSFAEVAARPHDGGLPAAHGLADLVSDWTEAATVAAVEHVPPLILDREFDRLLERTHMATEG